MSPDIVPAINPNRARIAGSRAIAGFQADGSRPPIDAAAAAKSPNNSTQTSGFNPVPKIWEPKRGNKYVNL